MTNLFCVSITKFSIFKTQSSGGGEVEGYIYSETQYSYDSDHVWLEGKNPFLERKDQNCKEAVKLFGVTLILSTN